MILRPPRSTPTHTLFTDTTRFRSVHQVSEISFGLAGEADHEGRAHRDVRANLAPALDPFEHLGLVGGAAHRLQNAAAGVLEGDVEIGEHQPLGHQRDDLIDMRSEEHTSELQSLMRISYAVFCLQKKKTNKTHTLLENN